MIPQTSVPGSQLFLEHEELLITFRYSSSIRSPNPGHCQRSDGLICQANEGNRALAQPLGLFRFSYLVLDSQLLICLN